MFLTIKGLGISPADWTKVSMNYDVNLFCAIVESFVLLLHISFFAMFFKLIKQQVFFQEIYFIAATNYDVMTFNK